MRDGRESKVRKQGVGKQLKRAARPETRGTASRSHYGDTVQYSIYLQVLQCPRLSLPRSELNIKEYIE
jgi:hypothetical protein